MSAFKDRCAIYTSFGDKLVFHAQSTKCWVMTNAFFLWIILVVEWFVIKKGWMDGWVDWVDG